MNTPRFALAALGLVGSLCAHAASIEINGDVTQNIKLNVAPVSAVAIGSLARAKAGVNVVEGNVKVRGSVHQAATLDKSPVSAVSIGPGAVSDALVNTLSGK